MSKEIWVQKYQSLVDYNPDGVFELDLEGHLLSVNRACLRLIGYGEEELLGSPFESFIDPADLKRTQEHFRRATAGEQQTYEIQLLHKEGHSLYGLMNNIPIFVDGAVSGVYGIVKDISAEKATMASIERYRHIVDYSPDAIILHRRGFITYINDAGVKLLQASGHQQLIGRHVYDFMSFSSRRDILERIRALLQGRIHVFQSEEKITCMNGQALDVEIYSVLSVFNERQVIHSVIRDISLRKQLERKLRKSEENYRRIAEQVQHMAFHDPLTGLPNRRLLKERLDEALLRAKQYQHAFAILYLDCDHFKPINDELGHDVGDAFLKSMAERMQDCLRERDTVARIGGDEFNILLTDIHRPGEVMHIAERILHAVNRPWRYNGKSFSVTSSVGIALYPQDGNDIDTLLKKADQALRRAKESGRNMIKWYQRPEEL